jgi:branched-subunit amino acid transport protein
MSVWLVIVVIGLGSYLFRISMVLLIDRFDLPEWLTRASSFVAPAAFAALAAGGVAAHVGGADLLGAVPVLGAVAAAVVAVRLTGKSYVALLAGMPVLWILTALVATS